MEHIPLSPLQQQLDFLIELEQLKLVLRRNMTVDRSRYENSAEHSWHVATMALVLSEHADQDIEIKRVLKMLLLHDVVEIYAGDTWLYATADGQQQKESEAAVKLFAMLPEDQGRRMFELWEEFESGVTAEALFARAIDALQPLLNHFVSGSADSDEEKPLLADVLKRKQVIAQSSSRLWEVAQLLAEQSADRGLYAR